MKRLGDIPAKKPIETLCDCQAVVTHRPAVVKVKTLAEKLAIINARRWSIHWQAEKQT